jgi:hypothetical protein
MNRNTLAPSPRAFSLMHTGAWITTIAASAAFATAAQADLLPQDAPHYRTGENWTYQFSEALSPNTKTVTQTVTNVRSDGSAILLLGPGGGHAVLTSDANVIPTASDPHPCGVGLRFPLRPGGRYEADCQAHSSDGQLIVRRAQCEVEGVENVTTKAGSFSAIKVRMTGTWSPQYGVGGGPMHETLWYAPSVKRIVRGEFQEQLAGKGAPATTEMELVRYAVKQ